MNVVGVDGCPDGWVCVTLDGGRVDVHHIAAIAELDARVPGASVVAIDIPMWFPTEPPRRAEVAARKVLKHRASSVFPTPVWDAIAAPDLAAANVASRAACGRGVSAQAYALAPKIREVDRWRRGSELRVCEVHPETSFAVMLGHPALHSKKTWAGAGERMDALRAVGIDLAPFAGADLGRAAVDDVLDAAAAAWTARRVADGTALRLPDDAPDDGDVIRA